MTSIVIRMQNKIMTLYTQYMHNHYTHNQPINKNAHLRGTWTIRLAYANICNIVTTRSTLVHNTCTIIIHEYNRS